MNQSALKLDSYFFPHQEVRANPAHDPAGSHHGSQTQTTINIERDEDNSHAIAVEVTISLDETKSENPPYFFKMSAFAFFSAESEITDEVAAIASIQGPTILIGAIRERLADLTARAPWGAFFHGPISFGLSQPVNETQTDHEESSNK